MTVILTDANDNAPVFSETDITRRIPEALENGESVPGLGLTVDDIDSVRGVDNKKTW